MRFILLTIAGFAGMEVLSYAVHRWLFHGVLWKIHRTHHVARKGVLEPNDIFTVLFALTSVGLMAFASSPIAESIAFPIGLGIAVYGGVYFVVHDLFIHRRFLPFSTGNKALAGLRSAHQTHHRNVEKPGSEPFGLLMFDPGILTEERKPKKRRSVEAGNVET